MKNGEEFVRYWHLQKFCLVCFTLYLGANLSKTTTETMTDRWKQLETMKQPEV